MNNLPQGNSQTLDIFKGLSPLRTQQLCTGSELIFNRHRELVFKCGEPALRFGFVISGCYKLYRPTPSGDTILGFGLAQEAVAVLLMANPTVYPINVQASCPSSILVIPQRTYQDHWLSDPDMMKRVQAILLNKCKGFHFDRALQSLNLREKIAAYLLKCIDSHSLDGKSLPFPLSRKEVGEAVGATEESVIRVMSAWEKSGVISTISQHIEVHNLGEIAAVAQGLKTENSVS